MNAPAIQTESRPLVIPFALSILIGCIFFLPNLLIPFYQDNPDAVYSPLVSTTFAVEETIYASGIREVFDGRFRVHDTQILEAKDSPSYIPWLPNYVLGTMAKVLGSVPRVYILCDFLFPLIIFLLVYALLFKMTENVWISSLGGAALLFGYHFLPLFPLCLKHPKLLISTIINYQDGLRPIVRFSRLPYNQFSFLVLILATFLTYLALTERKKYLLLIAGVATGLNFYSYFYHFTFITAAYCTLFLFFLIQKNKNAALDIFIILVVMTLTSIPYWLSNREFSTLPHFAEIVSRWGLHVKPIIMVQVFALIQVVGYLAVGWFVVRKKDLRYYFLISFMIGAILCYFCIPFLLGYGIQIFHWSTTALDPFILIFLAFVFFSIQEKHYVNSTARKLASFSSRYQKGICIGLIIFFLSYGLYTHMRFPTKAHSLFYLNKEVNKSYEWLNNNTEKDAVVASVSLLTINMLPTYTHCNNYVPNAGFMCTISNDEVIHRLAIAYKLFQVPPQYLEKALNTNTIDLNIRKNFVEGRVVTNEDVELTGWAAGYFGAKFVFGPWNTTKNAIPSSDSKPYQFPPDVKKYMEKSIVLYVPQEERDYISSKIEEFQQEEIEELLKKYHMDYIYAGPYEKELSPIDLSQYGFLKQVYSQGGIEIYKLRN